MNSNRAGKGIGASDCNSDVRSRENHCDECDGWIPLAGKGETETEMNEGGGSLKAQNYAGLTRRRREEEISIGVDRKRV